MQVARHVSILHPDPLGPSVAERPADWLAQKAWVSKESDSKFRAFVLDTLDAICGDRVTAQSLVWHVLVDRCVGGELDGLEWCRAFRSSAAGDLWTLERSHGR